MKRAFVFDLDGTLTVPMLDFDLIRSEIGIPDGPILETLARMGATERTAAEDILNRHERRAAEDSRLQDGARETIMELKADGFAIGILTRNARRWTRQVLTTHGVEVDAVRCREDGAIKPDPSGALALCRQLACEPNASWMVGDHRFDIEAGRGAGMTTVLMIGDEELPKWGDLADHVIRRLPLLVGLVSACRGGFGKG